MDTVDKSPATNSQLSTTGNPQNIGTQNLAAPKSDLQTTLLQNSNSTSFTITRVGDTTFTPFTATETSIGSETASPGAVSQSTTIVPVVAIALGVLFACIAGVWLLQKDARRRLLQELK